MLCFVSSTDRVELWIADFTQMSRNSMIGDSIVGIYQKWVSRRQGCFEMAVSIKFNFLHPHVVNDFKVKSLSGKLDNHFAKNFRGVLRPLKTMEKKISFFLPWQILVAKVKRLGKRSKRFIESFSCFSSNFEPQLVLVRHFSCQIIYLLHCFKAEFCNIKLDS